MTVRRIPGSAVDTGPLAFGAAYLVGGLEKAKSVRLVHAAFDAGFRHFDVAPPYGLSTAEETLAQALRDRRDKVTVTTKVGLEPGQPTPALLLAHALYQPLKRCLPASARVPPPVRSDARFDIAFVRNSLASSLRKLRTDRIDLLLLHEVRPDQITDELLTFLERMRREGVVGAIGIASSIEASRGIERSYPGLFDVFQYGWSVADPPVAHIARALTITHGAILRALAPVSQALAQDPSLSAQMRDECGVDAGQEGALAQLLVAAALNRNKDGMVIVASRRMGRVRSLARAAQPEVRAKADRFLRLLQTSRRCATSAGSVEEAGGIRGANGSFLP